MRAVHAISPAARLGSGRASSPNPAASPPAPRRVRAGDAPATPRVGSPAPAAESPVSATPPPVQLGGAWRVMQEREAQRLAEVEALRLAVRQRDEALSAGSADREQLEQQLYDALFLCDELKRENAEGAEAAAAHQPRSRAALSRWLTLLTPSG